MKIKHCCHCTLHSVISVVRNTCIEAYFGIRIIIIASSYNYSRSQKDHYAGY